MESLKWVAEFVLENKEIKILGKRAGSHKLRMRMLTAKVILDVCNQFFEKSIMEDWGKVCLVWKVYSEENVRPRLLHGAWKVELSLEHGGHSMEIFIADESCWLFWTAIADSNSTGSGLFVA